MSGPQPEYVWAFPPEKPKPGRLWMIILLALVAIAIAVGVFLMFLRPWERPAPAPTDTATASASPSARPSNSPSPTPSDTPSATPTPTATPSPTANPSQPPVGDPDLAVFRDRVQPRLDDAATGLSYARDADSAEGMQLVDQLRIDVGWMADAVAPRSIAGEWNDRVAAYGRSLDALRVAFEKGTAISAPLAAAEAALRELNTVLEG